MQKIKTRNSRISLNRTKQSLRIIKEKTNKNETRSLTHTIYSLYREKNFLSKFIEISINLKKIK